MAEHSTTSIAGGHTNAVAAGAAGFMSGADKTKLDGVAAGANVTGANPPQAHAASHVTGGSDVIATVVASGAAGLMSGADKAKLDGVAAGADVTAANAPQAHAASHVGGGSDAIATAVASGAAGLLSGADKAKLDGIAAGANVTGANPPQAHAASHVTGGSDVIAAAVAGGASGLMTGADKTKLDGLGGGPLAAMMNWGTTSAPGTTAVRYFTRTAVLNAAVSLAEYPVNATGTFTFTLTWRISGTKMTTDTIAIAIYKNGVSTGIGSTISTSAASGQASGSVAVTLGDGISVGLLQSATEANSNWLANVNVSAQ